MENAACGFETVNLVHANEASLAIGPIRNGGFAFAIAMAASFIESLEKSGAGSSFAKIRIGRPIHCVLIGRQ